MQMERIKIVLFGIGYIGQGLASLMKDKDWIQIVGAVDNDKAKIGKDLGEITGEKKNIGITVSDDIERVIKSSQASLVAHATPFFPNETDHQIMNCLKAGANVLTIADDRLAYPWGHWPELSEKFDSEAKKRKLRLGIPADSQK